ncbi:MAG: prolipoprotein diacylglyceryl transferase [Candidatus Hydrogenedentes bacterium]|nr:prolipoprotein diacylglyceryl transferase [Candidatus Hydrogenedentota bacterium]
MAPYLRIGSVAITPEGLLLPVAAAYFALLLYRGVYPGLETRQLRAILLTVTCCLGAVIGGRVYGFVQPLYLGEPVFSNGAWIEARFGSFGAVWAILAVQTIYGRLGGHVAFRYTDAAIPAICIASAIARVSCLFQGCCPSVPPAPLEHWLNPAYLWPCLDVAALSLVLVQVQSARAKWIPTPAGLVTAVYLCVYGLLRFGMESLRDTHTIAGPFTYGQVLAFVQIAAGLYVARRVRAGARQRLQSRSNSMLEHSAPDLQNPVRY